MEIGNVEMRKWNRSSVHRLVADLYVQDRRISWRIAVRQLSHQQNRFYRSNLEWWTVWRFFGLPDSPGHPASCSPTDGDILSHFTVGTQSDSSSAYSFSTASPTATNALPVVTGTPSHGYWYSLSLRYGCWCSLSLTRSCWSSISLCWCSFYFRCWLSLTWLLCTCLMRSLSLLPW